MTPVRRSSPVPPSRQIADDLRAQMESGELAEGQQLPPQTVLAERYGVSRATIQKALDTLADGGYLRGQPPQGVFVRRRYRMPWRPAGELHPSPSPEMDRFISQLTEEGHAPDQKISVEYVQPAPAEVAERLELGANAPVLVLRKRDRLADGEPFWINDSYFPLPLVEGSDIARPGDIVRGANVVLGELGLDQLAVMNDAIARLPTADECHRLQIGPGEPVLEVWQTGRTAEGRAVRCVRNVFIGSRVRMFFEVRKPESQS